MQSPIGRATSSKLAFIATAGSTPSLRQSCAISPQNPSASSSLSLDDVSSSSSFSIAQVSASTTTVPLSSAEVLQPQAVFEPVLPSSATLAGMGLIVTLCVVVAWVWQSQVVPTARTNLALSKRKGPLKDYLDELRESPYVDEDSISHKVSKEEASSAATDQTVSLDSYLEDSSETSSDTPAKAQSSQIKRKDRGFERWLFADWLRQPASKPGRQKEAALPILKNAKWNSGDNPVLVTTLLMLVGVVFTAVTERLSQ